MEMKTIQMTIDDELITEVDKEVKKIGTTRSAFTREALKNYLNKLKIEAQEKKQIDGYKKYPVEAGEFDIWAAEQMWTD